MADIQTEAPKFDPIAYQKQANEQEQDRRNGKPIVPPIAEKPKEPEKPKEATGEETDTEKERRISRSDRRRLKAFEEAAEWRGKAEALQSIVDRLGGNKSEAAPPSGEDDPEPLRTAYSSDADYNRALGRWDARQEAKKVVGTVQEDSTKREQHEQWEAHLRAMSAKAQEDIKGFKDWDEVAKAAAEADDAIEWIPDEHPTLMGLIASSDIQAAVTYHLAKHPDELQRMLDMSKDPSAQIRAFARLEGRIEKLYSSEEPKDKAAQAIEETLKDRTHPAEEKSGRNSAARDSGKPRPSTEVAARGGSAPPGDIRIGSPEWHARENERERAMRGR